MIGTEPVPVDPERPAILRSASWLFPGTEGERDGPRVSAIERHWIAARVWLRLWWNRLRFRFWWHHSLRLRLVHARLRLRL